jgi:mRNA interferase RelE/StbE
MYDVQVAVAAQKELRRLPRATSAAITKKLLTLAEDPRPRGCLKLQGHDDLWRVRVGKYRVIYSIADERLVVLIVRVAHRRDAYE